MDLTGRMNGPGAYLKKDPAVIAVAKKNRALEKALETRIPDEFWDQVLNAMK